MVHHRRRKKVNVVEDCRGGMTTRGFTLLQTWRSPAQYGHPSTPPVSIQECARRLNCSRDTIRSAMARGAPPPPRGSGATPPAITTAHRELIARRREVVKTLASKVTVVKRAKCDQVIRRVPYSSARAIAAQLKREHPEFGGVSPSTVARDLAAVGFVSRVRPVNPPIKDGDAETRVAFAKACLKKRNTLCKIHFTDEKYFNVNDHTNRLQWVPRKGGRALPRHRIQGAPSVLVWAAIGIDYRRLVVWEAPEIVAGPRGRKPKDPKKLKAYMALKAKSDKSKALAKAARRINATVYCDKILKPYINDPKRGKDVEFMHDGASAHTSLRARNLLKRHKIPVMDWPARSCDLNPIENFWAQLQQRVSTKSPVGQADLREAIKTCWKKFPQPTINKLVRSFASRCDKVVAAGGQHIKP